MVFGVENSKIAYLCFGLNHEIIFGCHILNLIEKKVQPILCHYKRDYIMSPNHYMLVRAIKIIGNTGSEVIITHMYSQKQKKSVLQYLKLKTKLHKKKL